MEKRPLHIAFVIAHPDDENIPFGLPAQLVQNGHHVKLLSLTRGDLGSHTIFSRRKVAKIRHQEFEKVGEILGTQTKIFSFPDGDLDHKLYKARRKLLREFRSSPPDVVIVHNSQDYHKDHRTAHSIGDWAVFHMPDAPLITRRFLRKIPSTSHPVSFYEMDTQGSQTWQSLTEDTGTNNDHLNPANLILPISEEAIVKSIEAFNSHKSQLGPRSDGQVGYVELAKQGAQRRGRQIGSEYGVGLNLISFGRYAFSVENKLRDGILFL